MPALGLSAASAHLVAWHTLGRRFSVGLNGPVMFLHEAQWLPALGWLFWAAVAVFGAAALFFGGGLATLGNEGQSDGLRLTRSGP
jgi:hypothetical protein